MGTFSPLQTCAPRETGTENTARKAQRREWLDETNSTGSEMLKNVELLKRDYNVRAILKLSR